MSWSHTVESFEPNPSDPFDARTLTSSLLERFLMHANNANLSFAHCLLTFVWLHNNQCCLSSHHRFICGIGFLVFRFVNCCFLSRQTTHIHQRTAILMFCQIQIWQQTTCLFVFSQTTCESFCSCCHFFYCPFFSLLLGALICCFSSRKFIFGCQPNIACCAIARYGC